LLRDTGDDSLQGFSTVQALERELGGRRFRVVYSGDTVCDKAYWGQRALQSRFTQTLITEKLKAPHLPLYWFLITKGYKTYLLMAHNFPDFWPRHDAAMPAREGQVLDLLAREKFGAAWRPGQGILRFDECLGRVKPEVAPPDARALENPHVRYFLEKNPGHAEGDELCCLGVVNARLCLIAARKYF
jgi:hypothetical protein